MDDYQDKGVISWFIKNPVAANLLLIFVIVVGIIASGMLRKEAFPSLDPSRVSIAVSYESGDPTQAEEGIALKIEEALKGVPGIKRITSTSDESGSEVVVEKNSDYDLDDLFSDVKSEVDAISNFPSDADNPVIFKASRQDHAIWVQLYGDTDRQTLQDLTQELKLELLQKSGISDTSITGDSDSYISIEINEDQLKAYGLSLSDVDEAINNESTVSSTTSLRNSEKTVRLKVADQFHTIKEFESIPIIATESGSIIKLGDIAKVEKSFDEDSFVLSRYNNQPGMAIEISMDEYGDITKISEQANEVVQDWKERNILPQGVSIKTWYDNSDMITERLSLLLSNALFGIMLVFVILALFLNITVAFWVAAGLPFIFSGTMLIMYFMGMTINEMTTFGFIMALGIVVDDAVVIGESVYSERSKYGDTISNTIKGTMRVAVPTIFGVLTTVATFMALSNIEGGLGQIFAQFGTVVTICLILSMIESKLILPSHLAHINTVKNEKKNPLTVLQGIADSGLGWFNDKIYRKTIEMCLEFRYAVVILFFALFLFIANMTSMGMVKVSFFPDIEEEVVNASVELYDDVSFGINYKNMMILEKAAYEVDSELMKSKGEIGSNIESLQISASSDTSGSALAVFVENPSYTAKEFSEAWKNKIGSLEGAKKIKVISKKEMVDNFNIQIKSSSSSVIYSAGNEIKDYLENLEGVSGIEDDLDPSIPQYSFSVNEYGRSLGITTSELSSQILENFGGGSVQKFQKDSLEITVSVRYPSEKRQTLENILDSNIVLSDGSTVPLSEVSIAKSGYQQSSIVRIDNLRAVQISAIVDKDVISSEELVQNIEEKILPGIVSKYPTLKYKFTGEAEQKAETMSSMTLVAIGAFLAIYALLAIPLKSYIQPVLIMTAIPFGIVGAILGHWFSGLTVSILSMFGILALSGVVVNDSLLLVSRYNELREKGVEMHQAIVTSCSGRLRAVLLTSFTTFAGLIPLLSETSLQAQFLKPAAASLGYGIMFATLITLMLIPSLLYIQEDLKGMIKKALNKK